MWSSGQVMVDVTWASPVTMGTIWQKMAAAHDVRPGMVDGLGVRCFNRKVVGGIWILPITAGKMVDH